MRFPKVTTLGTTTLEILAMALTSVLHGPSASAAPKPPPVLLDTIPPTAHCSDGDFRWTIVNGGGISLTPRVRTMDSVGEVRNCVGAPGITGATFTGVHIAMSDCMHPADGPLFLNVLWSNGQTTKLAGNWPVALAQPTTGFLNVTDGLGKGLRVQVVVVYEVMTFENTMACLGPGLGTSTGRILSITRA